MSVPAVVKDASFHTCPQSDGSKPHVGGPCISGAATVCFEDLPVCTVGDRLRCNSPSVDLITGGSDSLFIEDAPAALTGISRTAHGGIVVRGGCNTVFIGS